MKQPKIHITETNDKDWGIHNVKSITWHTQGYITVIQVDFNLLEYISLYNKFDGTYVNEWKNLIGKLI
jgi:hypothetical protein